MIRGIHHVGIAVRSLDEAYRFYRDVLGLPLLEEAAVGDQGVRAALLGAGDSEIELLEPLGAESGLARFIAKHGEGLHHVCFDARDVAAALMTVKDKGAEMIDVTPRDGLAGRIGFLHPRACAGVLVELAPPPPGRPAMPPSTLRFKRLIIGADDPRRVGERFQALFGFPEVALNGGPRVMLSVGRSAMLIVPHGEVGGTEGMVALSMVAGDFPRLLASLDAARTPGVLRGTGEVTLEPVAAHGVHLHVSRYE